MGGSNAKIKKLTEYELKEFAAQTELSYEEVYNLFIFFKSISALQKDDGVID